MLLDTRICPQRRCDSPRVLQLVSSLELRLGGESAALRPDRLGSSTTSAGCRTREPAQPHLYTKDRSRGQRQRAVSPAARAPAVGSVALGEPGLRPLPLAPGSAGRGPATSGQGEQAGPPHPPVPTPCWPSRVSSRQPRHPLLRGRWTGSWAETAPPPPADLAPAPEEGGAVRRKKPGSLDVRGHESHSAWGGRGRSPWEWLSHPAGTPTLGNTGATVSGHPSRGPPGTTRAGVGSAPPLSCTLCSPYGHLPGLPRRVWLTVDPELQGQHGNVTHADGGAASGRRAAVMGNAHLRSTTAGAGPGSSSSRGRRVNVPSWPRR